MLTGGDFDVESMRVGRDGTLWFGDPILEGPVNDDDPTTRRVYSFDIATRHYVERLPD